MGNFITTVLNRLFGFDGSSKRVINARRKQAHKIKNSAQRDLLKISADVERVKNRNMKDLDKINKDIKKVAVSVTKQIAIATGGRSRGYEP